MIKRRLVHKENPNRVEVQRKVLFWWVTETSPSGWVKAFEGEKFGEAFGVANIKCIDCGCELYPVSVTNNEGVKRHDWTCPQCGGGIVDVKSHMSKIEIRDLSTGLVDNVDKSGQEKSEPKKMGQGCEHGYHTGNCLKCRVGEPPVFNAARVSEREYAELVERVATLEEQLGINVPVNHKAMEALNHELVYITKRCEELREERNKYKTEYYKALGEIDKLRTVQNENEALKKTFDELKKERDAYKELAQPNYNCWVKMTEECVRHIEEKRELEKERDEYKGGRENAELRQANMRLQKERDAYKKENRELREVITKYVNGWKGVFDKWTK